MSYVLISVVHQSQNIFNKCATADPDGKKRALLIGGGITNFTDVAATFNGIIQALREKESKLKALRIHIYLRRDGPNYQTCLAKMRILGEELGVPLEQLLSSSMDKTVRLWDLENKTCLKLFAQNNYVTCIQFNPIDDSYFINGSLDAKVRIWSIPERKIVDWTDLHEMVTAVCYTPDGQGLAGGDLQWETFLKANFSAVPLKYS